MSDPVIKEMHAIKDANARRHRGDVVALVHGLKTRQLGADRLIVPVPKTAERLRRFGGK
jgi:hypothetical protein